MLTRFTESQLLHYATGSNIGGLSALRRLGYEPSRRLLTIDLFDTLLLRGVRPETARFQELADRLASLTECRAQNVSATAILEARLQCSKLAYQAATPVCSTREARIQDMLKMQLAWLALHPDLRDDFLNHELDFESARLRPNHPLVNLCRHLMHRGLRVAVVSDMYLDSSSLRRLLRHHGLDDFCQTVYVSSEFGVSKASGHLFSLVAEREATPFPAIAHVGDNFRADYIAPRRKGIGAVWLPRAISWRLYNGLWNNALRIMHVHLKGL